MLDAAFRGVDVTQVQEETRMLARLVEDPCTTAHTESGPR